MLKSAKNVTRHLIVLLHLFNAVCFGQTQIHSICSTLDITVNCVHAFNISADIILMFQLVTLQFERFILMHNCKAVECVTAILRCVETLGLRPAVLFENLLKFL